MSARILSRQMRPFSPFAVDFHPLQGQIHQLDMMDNGYHPHTTAADNDRLFSAATRSYDRFFWADFAVKLVQGSEEGPPQ